jgi:membrane protease YdiL (CAAX protease family)
VTAAARGFLIRVGIAVVAALLLAPVVGIWSRAPFHRLLTRVFEGALLVALLVGAGAPRTWPGKIRAMGLEGPFRARRLLLGLAVGAGCLVALLALSYVAGGRRPAPSPPATPLAAALAAAAAVALVVAFAEEVFCRGYLKDLLGGPASAVVFAAVHYVQPLEGSAPAPETYDPLLGFKRVHELVGAWTEPRNATLGFGGLLLLAFALNRLRERTGTLYAGVGLHAGLVFVLALYRRLLDGQPAGSPWIHGGGRVHDGALAVAALGLVLVLAVYAPLPAWMKHPGARRR